jgi:hypothetical protein
MVPGADDEVLAGAPDVDGDAGVPSGLGMRASVVGRSEVPLQQLHRACTGPNCVCARARARACELVPWPSASACTFFGSILLRPQATPSVLVGLPGHSPRWWTLEATAGRYGVARGSLLLPRPPLRVAPTLVQARQGHPTLAQGKSPRRRRKRSVPRLLPDGVGGWLRKLQPRSRAARSRAGSLSSSMAGWVSVWSRNPRPPSLRQSHAVIDECARAGSRTRATDAAADAMDEDWQQASGDDGMDDEATLDEEEGLAVGEGVDRKARASRFALCPFSSFTLSPPRRMDGWADRQTDRQAMRVPVNSWSLEAAGSWHR